MTAEKNVVSGLGGREKGADSFVPEVIVGAGNNNAFGKRL